MPYYVIGMVLLRGLEILVAALLVLGFVASLRRR
jgi:hypothetical protein